MKILDMKLHLFVMSMVLPLFYTMAQDHLEIDTHRSVIQWTGSNLFQFNKHFGTVKFRSGNLTVENDAIKGGKFVMDMNTILNTDGEFNEMLVWHLKNEDFFYVDKYPTSILIIKSINYLDGNELEIQADLTIKDITKRIDFTASQEKQNGKILLKSSFIIDRTRWNIDFGSKSVFDSLKNDIISDAIELEITIITRT